MFCLVYQNEADVYEPNHEMAFWGSNFPTLLLTKWKYNPEKLFDCWHCVGRRGSLDPKYKCYPKYTIMLRPPAKQYRLVHFKFKLAKFNQTGESLTNQ
ncbi:hypothetical protein BJ165DRAFT_1534295 [Panaeolus papilionaceus]|nr:hypothetical protein BJ165DRAFT_1534295 [Panaeolus papilionaceus]